MVCNTFLSDEFIYMHTSTCVLSGFIYNHDNNKVKYIRVFLQRGRGKSCNKYSVECPSSRVKTASMSNFYYTSYIFSPRVILINFYLFSLIYGGLGFWCWGLRLGVWGWGFQLMGFWACGEGPSGYLGQGSLYKHKRITLGKNCALHHHFKDGRMRKKLEDSSLELS